MPKLFPFSSLRKESDVIEDGAHAVTTPTSTEEASIVAEPPTTEITGNMDAIMRQMQIARADADQMIDQISILRVEAKMASRLRQENRKLAEQLDDLAQEMTAETEKRAEALRDLSRSEESRTRIATQLERSEKAASNANLEIDRIQDRLTSISAKLDDTQRELQANREARNKAEVDAASLRSNLSDRDQTLKNMTAKEAELRLQNEKDRAQLVELTETLGRRQRMLLERKTQCQEQADTIAQLEQQNEEAGEEFRALEAKHADLKLAHDARVYSLNNGLAQEQEGHRITRKLLDEMRSSSQVLTDENKYLKDQGVVLAQENQQMKQELGTTRSTIREYSDQLKDAHLRYSIAQDDVQRLESAVEKASKEARTLKRQADKADRVMQENEELQSRISSLQQSLERYRAYDYKEGRSNSSAPIPLRKIDRSSQSSSGPRLVEEQVSVRPRTS